MTRGLRALAVTALTVIALWPARAHAHVGSPDVFFEGDAGPYRLFVTVRTPDVIPGIAQIEIRSASPDVREVTVVPMRLTGPGSKLPPAPDRAAPSATDPQFFTASLWLMERGSLQVRIAVDGARGRGTLGVPVPAVAQRTLAMTPGLGALLLALMLVLALSLISILAGAARAATLEPGATIPERNRRRARRAAIGVAAVVVALLAAGNEWWNAEASSYAQFVARPWQLAPSRDGCRLTLPRGPEQLLPDHGHDMHLFVARLPGLDAIAHLHPVRDAAGSFTQALPSLPAGRYQLFADIVLPSGFPITGTGELELPGVLDPACPRPEGDDVAWQGRTDPADPARSALGDGATLVWDRPAHLRAGEPLALRFRAIDEAGAPVAIEPYMGMAGHAMVVRDDATVFAHLHPSGSVAMPALELARQTNQTTEPMDTAMTGMDMAAMHHAPVRPEDLAFPYGFPRPGSYRIFVQVRHAGRIVTGAFDARVE
jgi:hypothetical protein